MVYAKLKEPRKVYFFLTAGRDSKQEFFQNFLPALQLEVFTKFSLKINVLLKSYRRAERAGQQLMHGT